MKVHDLEKSTYLKALFYGDSGSGKTTLIGTAMLCEETRPLLVLNARGQPVSLRHLDPPPFVVEVENMEDFNIPYNWILGGQEREPTHPFIKHAVEYLEKYKFERFNSVSVDSITQVQRICRNFVLGDGDRLPGDLAKPTDKQKWGQILSVLMNMADLYYKLPIHVFMTALMRYDDVESLGMRLFYPFLWGQSAGEVPAYAELVGRLMLTESLPTKLVNAIKEKVEELPFNTLCPRSGRDYIAKWQGLSKPAPQYIFAPTVEKLLGLEIADS